MSCTTIRENKEISQTEQTKFEYEIGDKLAEVFDSHLQFENDEETLIYLTSVAERLFKSNVEEGNISLVVKLLKNQNKEFWNASLPGNRIYLSLPLLKSFKYENQLASSIAIEVAKILKKIVLKKIYGTDSEFHNMDQVIDFKQIKFQKSGGILTCSKLENEEIVRYAVEILYEAGYDPRGLIHYYQGLEKLKNHSPYSYEELEKLKQVTRKEIVEFPPLLNPIVRSNDFYKTKKRMQNL